MTTTDWIQAISMVVLVIVTAVYAWRTHVMSKATKEQAEASVKTAEEMKKQRYDSFLPIIDIIDIEQTSLELAKRAYGKQPDELRCVLHNVGVGPAIDVYSFVKPPSHKRQRYDFHTIPIGEKTTLMNLSLEQKDDRLFLVAYYRDVHDRCFESSREVKAGVVNPDPLKIRSIACEELP